MRCLALLAWMALLLLAGVGCSGDKSGPASNATAPVAAAAEILSREPPKKCFHRPAEDCPPIAHNLETPRCKAVSDDGVLCCHLTTVFQLKEGLALAAKNVTSIRSLHIRNATLHELNVTELEYHRIENFTMSDGLVGRIIGQFASSITCLNLSGNALKDIYDRALSSLSGLGILDVSNNNLTELPQMPQFQPLKLKGATDIDFWLDISGTNKFQCKSVNDIINQMKTNKNPQLQFSRSNDTYCWNDSDFIWFQSSMKISLVHIKDIAELEKCPDKCNCRLDKSVTTNQNLPIIVDCSGLGLTELPKELPLNTVALNVSNNQITNLDRLVEDKLYENIVEFYADNNLISSIAILESSKFLKSFDVLSLRDNKIRTIPTYILSDAFDHQFYRTFVVKLGNNKLECNCNTAQVVKVWLVAYKKHIQDLEDIQCEDIGKVEDLDKDKVCINQRPWTYYIYYIIGAEIALLLLLVVKVSYDYWVFKTAGYLPWPASKMPKLPCDWFFET